MRKGLTYILVLAVTSLTAAAQSSNPSSSKVSKTQSSTVQQGSKTQTQTGVASWYGKYFHGRPTASGEPYDMFLFTAAHRTLPLGTLVKVTNLSNGHSLVVRINDRGPVPTSRMIDLSYAAAQMLDFREDGVERVRLEVLGKQRPATVATAALR